MELKKTKNKKLEKQRRIFFLYGLTISLALVFLAFEWSVEEIDVNTDTKWEVDWESDYEQVVRTVQKEKPKPKTVIEKPVIKTASEMKIITDNSNEKETNIDRFNELETNMNWDAYAGEKDDEEVEEKLPALDWYKLKHKPEFPGGQNAFIGEIMNMLDYPEEAIEIELEGRVNITFVVDENGEMTNFKIIRGIHPVLDKAALNAIKRVKTRWSPGKQMGVAVPVKMNVPVIFRIQR